MKKSLIKSFPQACKVLDIDPKALPYVSELSLEDQKAVLAFYKLSKISAAAWKLYGTEIDWNNYDQWKYYPYFSFAAVGSGASFSYSDSYFVNAHSAVGARLVFPMRESAEEAATKHKNLYKDLMIL